MVSFLSLVGPTVCPGQIPGASGYPSHGRGQRAPLPLPQALTTAQAGAFSAASGPDLTIGLTHTSSFLQGQTNSVYLIRVANQGSAPTSGTITVVDSMPSGITITSMWGPGWSCVANTCARSDSWPAGQMLPTISVLATVAANAPPSVSNLVTVSGGGDSTIGNNIASDVSTIAAAGYAVTWGNPYNINGFVPTNIDDLVAISPGDHHVLGLRKNGTVVQWGISMQSPPEVKNLSGVIAIAAGGTASFALKSDGTVVAWAVGDLVQTPPANLADVVAITSASTSCIALKSDGTVVEWGYYVPWGAVDPAIASGIVAVSGTKQSIAGLRWDGSVAMWGNYAPAVPSGLGPLSNVTGLSFGGVGVRTDGTVVVWKDSNGVDLTNVPAGLSHVVSISAELFAVAVKDDGTVASWGFNGQGQADLASRLTHVRAAIVSSGYGVALVSAKPVLMTVQADTPDLLQDSPYYSSRPSFILDGQEFFQPVTWLVPPDSVHDLSVTASQNSSYGGIRYQFNSWSDGGAVSHTIAPVADTIYGARFKTQFQLTTSASTGGTISPATGFFDAGSTILVQATAQAGYVFSRFTGNVTNESSNPARLFLKAPQDWRANFAQPAGSMLQVKVSPARFLLQGQTNASFTARIANAGNGPATGISVSFAGASIDSAVGQGQGWTCTGSTCSRADALQPGQAYPALLFVAAISPTGGLTGAVGVNVTSSSQTVSATVPATTLNPSNAVTGWGDNAKGQATTPSGLTNVIAVAAGAAHSLALKGDGTVRAWGDNSKLQTQIPAGLQKVIAVAAGGNHNLALKNDGTVVAWGDNSSGQASVPAGLTNVIAISAGADHSLALKSDGTVVAWGANGSGQSAVPGTVLEAVSIAAAGDHSLAALSDGTVIAWGSNTNSESTVPGGLSRVEALAAGDHYSLALQDDGHVVAWGTSPASIVSALPGAAADTRLLAGGANHALALPWNSALQCWGSNASGQCSSPAGLTTGVTGMAGGGAHSLAITSGPVTVAMTLTIQPAGPSISVDGVKYSASQTFHWDYGSNHIVTIPEVQAGAAAGTQFTFLNWSDTHVMTTRQIAAISEREYTLTFKPQYLVTTSASAGGAIAPATGYFDYNAQVTVQATPYQGYSFSGFSGGLTGTSNPRTIGIGAPTSIAANFAAIPAKAKLKIDVRHTTALLQGQTNAAFLVRVGNEPVAGPTSGQVTVTMTAPQGLQITSMSGPGWACTTSSCTRSDVLTAGKTYPAITAIATVAANAAASLSVQASASGGGDPATPTATDIAQVNASATPVAWVDPVYNLHRNDRPFPAGLSNVVAVAAGGDHFLALKKDGTVTAWGSNQKQQCDIPVGLNNVIAISAGGSYSAALKSNGTVVTWGTGLGGSAMPAGLADVVEIAAGSSSMLALKADGTLAAWGLTTFLDMNAVGQAANVVALAASNGALGLTGDGVAINLGNSANDAIPAGLPTSVAIASGGGLNAAIAADGSVTFWGTSGNGGAPANWSGVASVALGSSCYLAIGTDHTVKQQGCASFGSSPAPKDVANALAADVDFSLAVILSATAPQVNVQVSSQAGAVTVDGVTYQQAQSFNWAFGSSHTVSVPASVDTGTGRRSIFASWSDGGAMAHTFTVSSVGAIQLTANFDAQVYLTTSATPGGTISPASGWYPQGQDVQLTATPSAGYAFTGFSGTYSASFTPFSAPMPAPATMTANFALITPQPSAVSVSPFSGSGSLATFNAIYKAGLGYKDLAWVQLLVAAAPDGGGQPYCFVHYDVQGDGFWLYGDGGFFVGPVKPGTPSGQLQNSLCALNTQMSSASGNGDTLGVGAKLAFKSAASLKLYMRAYTQGHLDTGWVERGAWTTAAAPLGSMLVAPSSGSGAQQTFAVRYPDPASFESTNTGWTQFLIAAATDGGGLPFCFVHYDKAGNGLWMYSGDVGFFLGPVAPGVASNALDSSACSINTAGATAVNQFGMVTVSVPVTLKSIMLGTKNLYQRNLDPLGRDSGWVKTGTWVVP